MTFLDAMLFVVFVVPVVFFFCYAAFDVLRRHGIGIMARILWLLAFCLLPILGPLVYLVMRPPGVTAEENALAGDEKSQTAELTALADLHDRGKLTDEDFAHAKTGVLYGGVAR
jgi:hypothetical protein